MPDAIRKRFAQGWKQHIPLQYLTDSFCSQDNAASAKELDDAYTLDGSRGIISVSKTLPSSPELSLSFADWFQAWGRLAELIETYLPQELPLWLINYNNLLNKPNKLENWTICVAYDSEVCRRACTTGIDPSVFHLAIWNDLEAKHIGRVAVETVRAEMAKTAGSSHGSKSQARRVTAIIPTAA